MYINEIIQAVKPIDFYNNGCYLPVKYWKEKYNNLIGVINIQLSKYYCFVMRGNNNKNDRL